MRIALETLTVGVAYFVAAWIGLGLSFGPDFVAPLWPPNAVLLAALLVSDTRRWPWFLLIAVVAEVAADLPNGIPLANALAYVAADWVEVLAGAVLIRRFLGRVPTFSQTREAATYAACCVLAAPLIASFPGAAASTFTIGGHEYWSAWRTWLVGDALTHLVITPTLVLWLIDRRPQPFRARQWRNLEAASVFIPLALVSAFVFSRSETAAGEIPALVYAPLPFLLWSAIRFRPRFVATAATVVTVIAIWSARSDLGPFTHSVPHVNLLQLQAFLFVSLTPLLLLSVLVYERNQARIEQQQLEERLRQSEKMEAIGQLAGGIAHDFNNLLTGILGNSEILQEEMIDDSENSDLIKEITASAHRAANLTRQLLAFSRRTPQQNEILEVAPQIDDAVRLLRRVIDRRISITVDHAVKKIAFRGDPALFHTTLLNLGLNARDAMPDGGEIRYRTTLCDIDSSKSAHSKEDLAPGTYVAIDVVDTGSGMDKDTQERIFEPFFTTKAVGQGTGLGLAAVYGFVRSHDGSISVSSAPGQGSTFRILLPAVADRQSGNQTESHESVAEKPKTSTILLIDDEELVHNVVRNALHPLGYSVESAFDGTSGLDIFIHNQFDAVMIDLVMPDINGKAVLETIRQTHPDIPAIIITGHASDIALTGLADHPATQVLLKPFHIDGLRNAISRALHTQEEESQGSPTRCHANHPGQQQ